MKRRWPSGLLLVAPVLVLVSLYMPWREASCDATTTPGSSSTGLEDLFACSDASTRVDGWSSVGSVAALTAVLLALATVGGFVWPRLWARSPERPIGLLLVYFVLALVAETGHQARQNANQLPGADGNISYHLGYGTYVGIAAAALVLAGLAFAGPVSWPARPPLRRLCSAALAAGVLAALLLPWQRVGLPRHESSSLTALGISAPSGAIAAVAAMGLLLASWAEPRSRALRLVGLALGTLLFAAATFTLGNALFSPGTFTPGGGVHLDAAWIGVACAAAAALVLLADRSLIRSIERPSIYPAAAAIAGTTVVASLFLPWQTACFANTSDFRSVGIAGRCVSSNGFGLAGSTAAVVTIALVLAATTLLSLGRAFSTLELAVGLALLIATLGFRLETGSEGGVRLGVGYGAIIGFVAAATLIALAIARSRWKRIQLKGVAPSLLPISLAAIFVTAVVLPWWGVLPDDVWSTFIPRFAALSWLTLASALVGIRLVFAWARRADAAERGPELVLLSLALVVLAVLETVPLPTVQLTWNGGVLLGLSVPLVFLALIEERQGLRNFRVPEVLRFDRL